MAKQDHARMLDDDDDSLLTEIAEIVLYPDAWLDTPNDRLGGQPPVPFWALERAVRSSTTWPRPSNTAW
jgi:hypothetical protein